MVKEFRTMEVALNVASDVGNHSVMFMVFDEERPTEVFNALKQAMKDIEESFKQAGILTEYGVGTGEMSDYVEYMDVVIDEIEKKIKDLYVLQTEVRNSDISNRDMLADYLQDELDELHKVTDKYYEMFSEVNYVKEGDE